LEHLEALSYKLRSLVIFRGLLGDEALGRLPALLSPSGMGLAEKLEAYAGFAASLFREGEDLTGYVWDRIASDENLYVLKCARGEADGAELKRCLMSELAILQEAAALPAREVRHAVGYDGYLPEWKNHPADFAADYQELIRNSSTSGYGAFRKHRMFTVADGCLLPVETPDPVKLSDLKGYERERKAVVDNTLALLRGLPAANVLLYGDAGTGKSSTIKAVVNEYAGEGLRLIEIRKDQLWEIPRVAEKLKDNPLKFILFIDDLSFPKDSGEVGALKAVLEGTVSARTQNVAVCATSNRRHIVNERFSDRGDDEIHRNETIQEQVSLSQRFGLSVSFLKPDKAQYLAIVRELAAQYDVQNIEEMDLKAERYAIERGGRSPRVAKQFVEALMSARE
jgi:predicted AAA+ superfamily ATPase